MIKDNKEDNNFFYLHPNKFQIYKMYKRIMIMKEIKLLVKIFSLINSLKFLSSYSLIFKKSEIGSNDIGIVYIFEIVIAIVIFTILHEELLVQSMYIAILK